MGWLALSLIVCLSMCLIGCDKPAESDSTPPDHIINLQKSQGKCRFGVTDTLSIEFSEKIDTGALALDFTPPDVLTIS